MKPKVILVRPKNFLSINNYPPLALVLLGTTLEQAGYDVEIYSVANHDACMKQVIDKAKDALLVGITALTTEVANALEISQKIKQACNTPIVWGGWHVTLFPGQCADSRFIDYAVVHEGDLAIVQIADALRNNKRPTDKIIRTEGFINLDNLPLPNYGLVKEIDGFVTSPLCDRFQEIMNRRIRWLPYQSSRGCPHKCSFCINIVTDNQQYRMRSAEKTVDELEHLTEKYKIDHFKILDDNFFVSKERVSKFCDLVLKRNIKFTWDGECRVDYFKSDYLNDDFLRLLRRTGLVQLVLGAESASKQTLRYLQKEISSEQTENAVYSLQKHGIVPDCAFIVGLPQETRLEMHKTAEFINRMRKYDLFTCGVQTYRPYPKSRIAEELVKQNKLYQPKKLEEWQDEKTVGLFTYVDAKRPWIEDYKFAMNISYYQSVASGVWLFQHQINNSFMRFVNSLFRKIAAFRSRYFFFALPFDKKIYSYFRLKVYQQNEKLDNSATIKKDA